MAYFQYNPQWQGPLPGRSFEKQTEDAINGLWGALNEVSSGQAQVATPTQNGLMTAADKAKLDGIEAGANNYVLPQATQDALGGVMVDTVLPSTSVNPVQNSAVTAVLDARVTAAMIDSLFS